MKFKKLILCSLLVAGYIGNSWGAIELNTEITIVSEKKTVRAFLNDIYGKLNAWALNDKIIKKKLVGKNLSYNDITLLQSNEAVARSKIDDVQTSEILKYKGVSDLLKNIYDNKKEDKLSRKGIQIKTFVSILKAIGAINDDCKCTLGSTTPSPAPSGGVGGSGATPSPAPIPSPGAGGTVDWNSGDITVDRTRYKGVKGLCAEIYTKVAEDKNMFDQKGDSLENLQKYYKISTMKELAKLIEHKTIFNDKDNKETITSISGKNITKEMMAKHIKRFFTLVTGGLYNIAKQKDIETKNIQGFFAIKEGTYLLICNDITNNVDSINNSKRNDNKVQESYKKIAIEPKWRGLTAKEYLSKMVGVLTKIKNESLGGLFVSHEKFQGTVDELIKEINGYIGKINGALNRMKNLPVSRDITDIKKAIDNGTIDVGRRKAPRK